MNSVAEGIILLDGRPFGSYVCRPAPLNKIELTLPDDMDVEAFVNYVRLNRLTLSFLPKEVSDEAGR